MEVLFLFIFEFKIVVFKILNTTFLIELFCNFCIINMCLVIILTLNLNKKFKSDLKSHKKCNYCYFSPFNRGYKVDLIAESMNHGVKW